MNEEITLIIKTLLTTKCIHLVIVIDHTPYFDDTGVKVEFHAFDTAQEPQQVKVFYFIPAAVN